ncbi:MAG: hypothetical protein RL672_1123 [Actinomycetota bacterium]
MKRLIARAAATVSACALALGASLSLGVGAGIAATPSPAPTTQPTAQPTAQPVAPELAPGVYVLRGSAINLVSRESKIPIAIRNTFDSDVRVHVHVSASNPRVIVPSAVEVAIPAGTTVTAQVPVKAVAQGKVFLIVSVSTFSGIRLTKDSYIQMNVEPDVELALIAAFVAVVLALGGVGAVRTIKRRKANPGDAS